MIFKDLYEFQSKYKPNKIIWLIICATKPQQVINFMA